MTALSPEQQRIAAAKQININRPVDDVLALLRALVEFDASVARRRKWAGGALAAMIVLTIISFFVAINRHGSTKTTLIAAGLVLLVGIVIAGVVFAKFKAADLSDNLRVAAAPFLTILHEDMNGKDPLHVKIDLRSSYLAEKKRKESAPYASGAYYKVIDRFFVDPWFSGSAVLADGTRLQWEVTEHIFQRTRTKKNPRGKTKTKTKEKRGTTASVTLGFPNKEYAVTAGAEDVKSGEKRQTMTFKRKLKSDRRDSPAFEMLVDLMAEGYRRVAVPKGA